jgi:hypothetical protein
MCPIHGNNSDAGQNDGGKNGGEENFEKLGE